MDIALILLAVGISAVVVAAYFLFASFAFGAGYQPTPARVVERMLALAEVGPGDLLYDLGAGTGTIVFRAARSRGARVVGIEVEPIRVAILHLRRILGGPRDRVEIQWGNLFGTDFRTATVVAVFLWPGAMARLAPLLRAQLGPGTRIISHWHQLPGWTEESFDRRARVYLYRVPGSISAVEVNPQNQSHDENGNDDGRGDEPTTRDLRGRERRFHGASPQQLTRRFMCPLSRPVLRLDARPAALSSAARSRPRQYNLS